MGLREWWQRYKQRDAERWAEKARPGETEEERRKRRAEIEQDAEDSAGFG